MSGTLFVVATPIGNLEDVTLRALRVLREVDLIAAEDTRRTARLLARHGISTPVVSFHHHNTRARLPQLVGRLSSGSSIALVTDAGTPGVSDPGVELVRAAIEHDISIDPIPGASASLTAAVASGFPLVPFTFLGFPPTRSKDRTAWFSAVSDIHHTVVFFESPLRVLRTLREGSHKWGNRQIFVGRELTKRHQQFFRGTADAVSEHLIRAKGEITVALSPVDMPIMSSDVVNETELAAAFGRLTNYTGVARREAIRKVANEFKVPARAVYQAVEAAKKSANRPNGRH
jgi:16S rRNA (cytidine1402-2'-O)-methyltransferase